MPKLARTVPDLEARVEAGLDELRGLEGLPPATRVHGDYHLGKTLRGSDGRGRWYVLDFEGEPLRPLADRSRPDQPLRDVAGMLRSFDYAAAVGGVADPGWLPAVRSAFLDGYRSAAPLTGAAGHAADVLMSVIEIGRASCRERV